MAHNKDDNTTANRPWFGPIPTGADWNPAHRSGWLQIGRDRAGWKIDLDDLD